LTKNISKTKIDWFVIPCPLAAGLLLLKFGSILKQTLIGEFFPKPGQVLGKTQIIGIAIPDSVMPQNKI
jgi:hypothetical protein